MSHMIDTCICCGLVEYDGLNRRDFNAKAAFRAILDEANYETRNEDRVGDGTSFAHVVMTQMWEHGNKPSKTNLDRFIEFVNEHEVGSVVEGPAKRNPNTGNWVKPALFTLSVNKCNEWWRANIGPQKSHEDWRHYTW